MDLDQSQSKLPWRHDRLQGERFLRRHRAWRSCLTVALVVTLFLCSGPCLFGQCALARIGSEPKVCGATSEDPKKLLPEDGYLDTSRYTNLFFGFSLDLPIASDWHRITIPVMLEKQHALLAIGFLQENRFGTLTITAEESPQELERYPDLQQDQCDDVVESGPQPRRPIPGFMLSYGAFYANTRRSGKNQKPPLLGPN